ncbi:MAG: hypothetical protein ACP5QA_15635 [Phycisphaerae bacterium]
MKQPTHRPEILVKAPMQYAPENELGVVLLFSHLSSKLQLKIEKIQAAFPDCIAYQRIGQREKRIRIEFEYRSRNFRSHGHRATDCDWIVCWEHNWPDAPRGIFILELRRFFGHGFNVWMLVQPPQDQPQTPRTLLSQGVPPSLIKTSYSRNAAMLEWGVGSGFRHRPQLGDLVAIHHAYPASCIHSLYTVSWVADKSFRATRSYPVVLKRVCILQNPLRGRQVNRNPFLNGDRLHRGVSNRKITEYWWALYDMIIRSNPELSPALSRFLPERV